MLGHYAMNHIHLQSLWQGWWWVRSLGWPRHSCHHRLLARFCHFLGGRCPPDAYWKLWLSTNDMATANRWSLRQGSVSQLLHYGPNALGHEQSLSTRVQHWHCWADCFSQVYTTPPYSFLWFNKLPPTSNCCCLPLTPKWCPPEEEITQSAIIPSLFVHWYPFFFALHKQDFWRWRFHTWYHWSLSLRGTFLTG